MTVQSVSSIVRQIVAYVGLIFSVLTQAVAPLKLSPLESFLMGLFGAGIIAIEHFVGDPSTGTPASAAALTSQLSDTLSAALSSTTAPANTAAPTIVHAAPAAAQPGQSLP